MTITTKNRATLKSYFVKNAIPTQENFAELIDAQLNMKDDEIFKTQGEPLSLVAAQGDQKRVLRLYSGYPAPNPDWLLSLKPAQDPNNPATTRAGFGVTDGAGNTRLFIDPTTGNLGVGTNNPSERLTVRDGDVRIEGGRYRRLMIVSDRHWAGIELVARQNGEAGHPHIDFTHGELDNPNYGVRVYAPSNDELSVDGGRLTVPEGISVQGAVAHIENDGAFYRNTDGQVYITVDDNLYIRNVSSASWGARFITNGGRLQINGNAPLLDMIGSDHAYIQWYPQGVNAGRKGWIGYGGAGTTTMSIQNDAGPLALGGTYVSAAKLNVAGYGPQTASVNAPTMEIGGPNPIPNGSKGGILYLHDHGRIAHQLRYSNGTLYLEAAGNGYGTSPRPTLALAGDVSIEGKHALRGNDPWLRLNQDGAFTAGVHTPGNFAPNSLNVGGANGWGNPGGGNVWVTGEIRTWGARIIIGGSGDEQVYIGGDGAGNDVQIGSTKAGVRNVVAWNWADGWMDLQCRNLGQHSDERSKEDIEPIVGALAKVLQLQPVSFLWKTSDTSKERLRNIGLVAQRVRDIVPEAVIAARGDSLAIEYNAITSLLIGAIKDLQEEINRLRGAIEETRARMNEAQ